MNEPVDEWAEDIEELKKELGHDYRETEQRLKAIYELINSDEVEKAKKELIAISKKDSRSNFSPQIKFLLNLCERHTVKLLFLSIPAIFIYHLFFASCLAFIWDLALVGIQKYSPKADTNELASLISILMVIGPMYGIRWARKRCQTACRPMLPWKILVPLTLLLTLLLLSMYDFLFVTGFLALRQKISWGVNFQTILHQYIAIRQINFVPSYFLRIFSQYYLAAVGLAGTLAINYYGGLKKDSLMNIAVEAYNEAL